MSDHPRLRNLRSTAAILNTANASFNSKPVLFLFLSLLLFSFRSFVETGSYQVISYIDSDPTLRSLLSRRDHPSPASASRLQLRHDRRRRPLLHLTRVGNIDDDLFSEATASDPLFPFSPRVLNSPNGTTLVILSNFRADFRFQEIVRPGVKLKVQDSLRLSPDSSEVDDHQNVDKPGEQEFKRAVDLQFFINDLELGHPEAAAFFSLISFLSAAYAWVILGFLVIYSWAYGAVFVAVVNDLMGRFRSFYGVLWDGSRLGLERLPGFILMRWAVLHTLTQLLGLWFFGEMEDQYSFFKLFVRLKLMPFSVMLPWVQGINREISWFYFVRHLTDTLIGCVFALDSWIAIIDSRKSGREIVKEGCFLVLTMFSQAVQLRCLEEILCGDHLRWMFDQALGRVFASVLQSTLEVYFMVVWLFFYLSTRCRGANSEGRRFELRELAAAFLGVS
ncbi:hypothetical protein CRG98_014461 [Punica granatum]|uniref:Uncharacterized protein n=1 Tax=Punica granatum TaxID=22663 RepID=A0A2I0K9C1_PUNGR|nr:hypothetical protein CRG98_014461 [Punica granatum]